MNPSRHNKATLGFSLIELLVAMAVTMIVVVLLVQVMGIASSRWRGASESAKAFQSARAAFEAITSSLAQATLAPSYDYYNSSRQSRLQLAALGGSSAETALQNFVPDVYGRSSGLHFISGRGLVNQQHTHAVFFQAPLDFAGAAGTNPSSGRMNATGFFVMYGSDAENRPPNISPSQPEPRQRYRLFQYLQPTDQLDTYRDVNGTAWFTTDVNSGGDAPANTHVLAENIVVLAILPKLPDGQGHPADAIAPDYLYDSRTPWTGASQPVQMHQLPPEVRVVMVAIDEEAAKRNPNLGAGFDAYFRDPKKLAADIAAVEGELRNQRANYRIFQTDIPLRAAKWSE